MAEQFDLEKLKELPINEVLVKMGASYKNDREPGARTYNMFCFGAGHSGKNTSLSVWKEKNICKCQSKGCVAGDPISAAKAYVGGDFKEGCKWLHDTFGVPYLESTYQKPEQTHSYETPSNEPMVKSEPKKEIKQEEKQTPQKFVRTVEYMRFDANKAVANVNVENYLGKYEVMSREQQLKMVYSYIYQYSLITAQAKKNDYYKSRSVDIENPYIKKIGFLSGIDIRNLEKQLKEKFPLKDLIEFKIFGEATEKYPSGWKYWSKAGYTVVPFMEIYSNLVNGFMLRRIDKKEKGKKEYQVSYNDISLSIPFAVNAELLRDDQPIYMCEGHVDGLSTDKKFIAIPGVNGYKEEWFGLLEGKHIVIALDQDIAATKSVYGEYLISYMVKDPHRDLEIERHERFIATNAGDLYVKELTRKGYEININKNKGIVDKLYDAGVKKVDVLSWNAELGGDINELREKGNLAKVIRSN